MTSNRYKKESQQVMAQLRKDQRVVKGFRREIDERGSEAVKSVPWELREQVFANEAVVVIPEEPELNVRVRSRHKLAGEEQASPEVLLKRLLGE